MKSSNYINGLPVYRLCIVLPLKARCFLPMLPLNIDLILNIWGIATKFADGSKSFKGSFLFFPAWSILCILCFHFVSPHSLPCRENLIPRKNIWPVYLLEIPRSSLCILHTRLLIHPSKFIHLLVMEHMTYVVYMLAKFGDWGWYSILYDTYRNMSSPNVRLVIRCKIFISTKFPSFKGNMWIYLYSRKAFWRVYMST